MSPKQRPDCREPQRSRSTSQLHIAGVIEVGVPSEIKHETNANELQLQMDGDTSGSGSDDEDDEERAKVRCCVVLWGLGGFSPISNQKRVTCMCLSSETPPFHLECPTTLKFRQGAAGIVSLVVFDLQLTVIRSLACNHERTCTA